MQPLLPLENARQGEALVKPPAGLAPRRLSSDGDTLPVGRENPSGQFFVMHDEVLQAAQEFDVVRLSMGDLPFPAVRQLERPTLHGRLDLAE
jgi:hypothetical protein